MRRVISTLVIIIGVIAALVTIATGIVFFRPDLNPFRSGPPNIAGEWDGSLTINTNAGSSGAIHLSIAEKDDGALTGRLTTSPPLSANNNGPLTVGAITTDGHVDFTVEGDTGLINLNFTGIYDSANHRLSDTYFTQKGFAGTWYATKSKSASVTPVVPPALLSVEGLSYVAQQVFRGGISLLLIILGLILAKDRRTHVLHAAH
jgi:hypothetical protein